MIKYSEHAYKLVEHIKLGVEIAKPRIKVATIKIPYGFNAIGEFQEVYLHKTTVCAHVSKSFPTKNNIPFSVDIILFCWHEGRWSKDEKLLDQINTRHIYDYLFCTYNIYFAGCEKYVFPQYFHYYRSPPYSLAC